MPITPLKYDNNQRVEEVEERNDLNQEEYNVNDIQIDEGPGIREICYEGFDKNNDICVQMEKDKILEDDMYYNRLLKSVKQDLIKMALLSIN